MPDAGHDLDVVPIDRLDADNVVEVHELGSEIDIEVWPKVAWQVLTDFASYPEWNPYIRRVRDKPALDSSLNVYLAPPKGLKMRVLHTVVAIEPDHELRWRSHVFVPGLLDRALIFEIWATGEYSCRFVQRERFSGLLGSAFIGFFGGATQRGIEAMNLALQ